MTTRREFLDLIKDGMTALIALEVTPYFKSQPLPLQQTTRGASVLPPIKGPIILGEWHNDWAPSEWEEDKIPGYPWRGTNAYLDGTDLQIRVTERASGQVQQNDRSFSSTTRWETDVTLANRVPGLIQAPLWTFNRDTRDEIDFEWVGSKGLQLNVYAKGVSVWTKLITGSFSRHHIAIEYDAGKSVTFLMDGLALDRVTPAMTGGAFPDSPMKAYIEAWPSSAERWAGRWAGAGHGLTMTVHGFQQS